MLEFDHAPGTYALLAHLRRRSPRVVVGQRVAASEQLAECGNSGNSSEPHVHLQLMDRPGVVFAAGGLSATGTRFRAAPPG